MTVGFHSNTLTVRGSENALFDYAVMNETVLHHRSVLCTRFRPEHQGGPVLSRWQARFPVIQYRDAADLRKQLADFQAKALYLIKPGEYDGWMVPGIRNCIHAMFPSTEFHGDAFAYVSRWISRVMTSREDSFVPHLVPRLVSGENRRAELGIPGNARVFGRHGGYESFNIPFVRRVVLEHARRHPQDHFVFLNTRPMDPHGDRLPNIHHLPATADPGEKARFLATCDAMIHAELNGETFGLAAAEFAVLGKPVLTFAGAKVRAHLEMLGDQAVPYRDGGSLKTLLEKFNPRPASGSEYERYTDSEVVMGYFSRCFLEGLA